MRVRVGALQWAERQAVARSGERKVAWPQALVALVKQSVEATSPETVISDSASKVSRSGSAA